jgi:hypothetical protein
MDSLLLLLGRGAAVLCANNQTGIDAILVFLRDGTNLVRRNAGLCLVQVKNDPKYSTKPQPKVFSAMEPISNQFFDKSTSLLFTFGFSSEQTNCR